MNALTYVGIILFIIGFGIEIVADNQKTAFRSIEANKDSFITSGLWSKSDILIILEKCCYGLH